MYLHVMNRNNDTSTNDGGVLNKNINILHQHCAVILYMNFIQNPTNSTYHTCACACTCTCTYTCTCTQASSIIMYIYYIRLSHDVHVYMYMTILNFKQLLQVYLIIQCFCVAVRDGHTPHFSI